MASPWLLVRPDPKRYERFGRPLNFCAAASRPWLFFCCPQLLDVIGPPLQGATAFVEIRGFIVDAGDTASVPAHMGQDDFDHMRRHT